MDAANRFSAIDAEMVQLNNERKECRRRVQNFLLRSLWGGCKRFGEKRTIGSTRKEKKRPFALSDHASRILWGDYKHFGQSCKTSWWYEPRDHQSYNILQWRCEENIFKIIKRYFNSCRIEEEWSFLL